MTTYHHAVTAYQSGEVDKAKEMGLTLLQENPSDAAAYHLLAIIAAQTNALADAKKYAKSALSLQPKNHLLLNTLGNIYKKEGHYEQAIEAYNTALKYKPDYPSALSNKGSCHFKQGNLTDALLMFDAALAIAPNHLDAQYNTATLKAHEKNYTAAKKAFHALLKKSPTHVFSYNQLAQIYIEEENTIEAIKCFKKSLEIATHQANIHYDLALLLIKENRYDEAIASLAYCIEQKHPEKDIAFHLANLHQLTGNADQALTYYMQHLSQGKDLHTYYNIGVLLMNKGRNKDALTYFEAALDEDDAHLDSLLNIAALYLKSNKQEDAIRWYQKAAAVDPNNLEIKHILSGLTQSNDATDPTPYAQHLFDSYADNYDTHLTQTLDYRAPAHIFNLLKQSHSLENPLDILDVGCGTGLMAEKLAPYAKNIVGIDLSEKMLAVAKEKQLYSKLIQADFLHYSPTEAQYDLAIAADVFVYITHIERVFKLIHQHLKPGGLFVFTIENSDSDDSILQTSLRYAHHPEYIVTLARQTGFSLLSNETVNLRKQQDDTISGSLFMIKKGRG